MDLIQRINNLPSTFKKTQALSGKEILDAMILIADEMEKDFENQDLNTLWHPFINYYNEFMQPILEKHNLLERILENGFTIPFSGYPKQYHMAKKDYEYISDMFTFIDKKRFDSLDENHILLGINYINWFHMNDSSKYFSEKYVEEWFGEYCIPNAFSKLFSKAYVLKEKMKGFRTEEDVYMHMKKELDNKNITPKDIGIDLFDRDRKGELFVYNNRPIIIEPKVFRDKNKKDELGYGTLNLVFGSALYYINKENKKEEPLAYVILNSPEKIRKFFMIEDAIVKY